MYCLSIKLTKFSINDKIPKKKKLSCLDSYILFINIIVMHKNEQWNKISLEWIEGIHDKISLILPRFLKSTWEIKKWEIILQWVNTYSKFKNIELNIDRIIKYDFLWKPNNYWNARFTDKETLEARADIHPWEIITITDDKRCKPIFRAPNMFIYNLIYIILYISIIIIVAGIVAFIESHN